MEFEYDAYFVKTKNITAHRKGEFSCNSNKNIVHIYIMCIPQIVVRPDSNVLANSKRAHRYNKQANLVCCDILQQIRCGNDANIMYIIRQNYLYMEEKTWHVVGINRISLIISTSV